MTITDPTILLDDIDMDRLHEILGTDWEAESALQYVEPAQHMTVNECPAKEASIPSTSTLEVFPPAVTPEPTVHKKITGKIHTLGDFIDTDALAPAEALVGNLSAEETGKYCLCHTHPDFRRRVKEGSNIVVAGKAFGVGSSRENAVSALMGVGVQCVIARSFAFIYARNQPNLGLLGIVMEDDEFYKLAVDEADIEIRVDDRIVKVGGREFDFKLSELEMRLWEQGGMSAAFAKWGKAMLENVTGQSKPRMKKTFKDQLVENAALQW
jgi:3-isopropylmalate dehydratase small subunit